jgi:hypothetical protein
MKTVLAFAGLLVASALSASAATTVNATNQYAYAANLGWINARGDVTNGAVLGYSYCTGYLWSANAGWISLGRGPTNGWHYSNASANDWGINHDGDGRLAGYAYGANIGWINFEQSQGQPRIDLRTGNLSGYAWGANVGWISLSNAQAFVQSTLSTGPDSDGDGIPDAWEQWRAGNLTTLSNGVADADADGVPDVSEYLADTDPLTGENLAIQSFSGANGTNTITWSSRPTRLYYVEVSNVLAAAAGSWADAGSGLLGPPAGSLSTALVSQAGATSNFIRVRAVVPLGP